MKRAILIIAAIFLAGCYSCEREEEDFTPYPGGTYCDGEPGGCSQR